MAVGRPGLRKGTPAQPSSAAPAFSEYHWLYLPTGNKLTDLVPTTLRRLVRPP